MASIRDSIQFLLNDRKVVLGAVGAGDTLLDWLRLDQRLTGSKEGCAEGDCGACTVLVGRIRADGTLVYESVNSCIRLLASLDGCHVVTVEHLRRADGSLHPVQAAMVEHHGSQCGFCTPGIVMSLYGLWMSNPRPSRAQVEVALQGNLCRCTGYRPIVDAAMAVGGDPATDPLVAERDMVISALAALNTGARVDVSSGGSRVVLPASVDDAVQVLAEAPGATIVAGSTDVGLWVTKFLRDISPAVFIGHLTELQTIEATPEALTIGAGVTYSDARDAMVAHVPDLGPFWDRIGGWQVRNMGTVGGNIANGSPIGDTPPPLIALGARLRLVSAAGRREIPLEAFFIDYGKQDRAPGELVEGIVIPTLPKDARFATYKISKRRDEDISALCGAFYVTREGERVTEARIAFGGMAATPKRAAHVEAALVGSDWTMDTIKRAKAAFADDFTPLTDWRASAAYRSTTAANLLERFYLESCGTQAQLERSS